MNYKLILKILGKVFIAMSVFLCLPYVVGIFYNENLAVPFLIPAGVVLVIGLALSFLKSDETQVFAKEGFVLVAVSWIILSLIGTVPFVLSGAIPNFIDAFFETVSGFTTTGATILSNVESLGKGVAFWRIFTHYLGGMGVLVFILAIVPSGSGFMHIYRAEAPGPDSSKLVSKMAVTARILYAIYLVFTVIETVLLLFSGMSFYDALLTSLSTAGTGGFSMYNDSIAHFDSVYVEMVVASFMFLFGINFNVFYLILIKQFKKAFINEELIVYFLFDLVAIFAIAINLLSISLSFGEGLRYAFFTVTSISSSTGFSTANFGEWPALSKSILTLLMIIGACGGSTGGGMKVARFIILSKTAGRDVKKVLNPRAIPVANFDGVPLDREIERNVRTYAIIWALIVIISVIILSTDLNDIFTNISASLSCIGNVGPVFNNLGTNFNFGCYSAYSKIWLSIVMLAGRLEIFPIFILFSFRTWKR